MASVTVTLIFTGLIAFVPTAEKPPRMTAFLVAADDHVPDLAVKGVKPCPENFCQKVGEVCRCSLKGVLMSIDQRIDGQSPGLPEPPTERFPRAGNADSLSWLVRLKKVYPGEGKLKRTGSLGVSHSVTFGWNTASVCEFDFVRVEGVARIQPMQFRAGNQEHEQAIAEAVSFQGSATPPVTITLAKPGATATLTLNCANGACPAINLSNVGSGDLRCEGEECDKGYHFAHFYGLAEKAENYPNPIPVRGNAYIDAKNITATCPGFIESRARTVIWWARGRRTVGSKIICPMAVLEP